MVCVYIYVTLEKGMATHIQHMGKYHFLENQVKKTLPDSVKDTFCTFLSVFQFLI